MTAIASGPDTPTTTNEVGAGVPRRLARRGESGPEAARPFEYRALDQAGEMRTGRMTSLSEADAVARLRRLGLRPVRVRSAKADVAGRELSVPGFGKKVKPGELAVLARQFATMVSAGVPLLRSLSVLSSQADNPLLQSTLEQVRTDIEAGDALSDSIGRHPKVFDHFFVSMVRAGEAAGALDVVLLQLAATLEKQVAVRQKIRSALAYPTAVLVMIVGVITAMLVFVVPIFAGIYDDLGGTLPLPTRMLVGLSEVLTTRLPFVVVGVGATVVLVRRWIRTDSGRHRWHAATLRLPLVGSLLRKSAIARFGRTMSVLTRAGVPVLGTLRITAETVGNSVVERAVAECEDAVRRGEAIAPNLARHEIFPAMVIQLVTVGEETGSLDQMLDIVGTSFEEEVDASVAGFSALIEPLLMAVIGLIVGGMVVALYLPMFRIIDLVQ